jgi:hypothetical protein
MPEKGTSRNLQFDAPNGSATARAAIDKSNGAWNIDWLTASVEDKPRHAEVHNLLSYSHRKQSMPNLARAFEHYPMNMQPAAADKHPAALEQLCGNKTCEDYVDLAHAPSDYRAKNRV